MKKLKKEIKRVSPVLTEFLIFLAYISALSLFHTHLLWGIITAISILLIIIILLYVIKSNLLRDIKKRLTVHAILNLIFLISLLITIIFSYGDAFYTTYFLGIALNLFIEVEFIFYLGLSTQFSHGFSNILSWCSILILIISSLGMGYITKDNWVIVGLIGAFLNHVLNLDNLLATQNKEDEEIKATIKKYKLKTKFWILKGLGLSIILSWAASLFVFNNVIIMGKSIPQPTIIMCGVYACIIIAITIYFIFSRFIIEAGEKQRKKDEETEEEI